MTKETEKLREFLKNEREQDAYIEEQTELIRKKLLWMETYGCSITVGIMSLIIIFDSWVGYGNYKQGHYGLALGDAGMVLALAFMATLSVISSWLQRKSRLAQKQWRERFLNTMEKGVNGPYPK